MKKLVALTLLLALVLTLCACGKDSGDNAGTKDPLDGIYAMGYARVNVTPMMYSVPLAGYGNTENRMSNGLLSYLYTTCIALTDAEGDTVLLFQNDQEGTYAGVIDPIRAEIASKTGVPVENVIVGATHTHSAPDYVNSKVNTVSTYCADLGRWMVEAAEAAMADRKEITGMSSGSIQIPVNTLNFTRHYTTEAGIVKGDNFGDLVNSDYTGHVRDADAELQIVRIQRKDADTVSILNFQTHPHRTGGSKKLDMSADLVGAFQENLTKATGDLTIYFTGASGNINPTSRIEKENITADFKEHGKALSDYAVKCLDENMTEHAVGDLQIINYVYVGQVNHTEDDKVEAARKVQNEWTTNNDFTAAVKLANKYGINSPYHANGIISKSQLGDTYDVSVCAISIGDAIGFVTAPFEMYSEQGEFIKEHSPFARTIVITMCNGHLGYIPSELGYSYNSYGANTGKFVSGTAEKLANEYVRLLTELYEN